MRSARYTAPWSHAQQQLPPTLAQVISDLKAIQAQAEKTAPTLYWQIGYVVQSLHELERSS